MERRVGFLGAGQMARALAAGMLRAGMVRAEQLLAMDPSADAIRQFQAIAGGSQIPADGRQMCAMADVLVVAVKPAVVAEVLIPLRRHLRRDCLLVSVAAGVTLSQLRVWSGTARWVRAMPNTPCLIGQGASAFSRGRDATDEDIVWVEQALSGVGYAVEVAESQLDAVTGLSGSGPAYVFLMIEALADAGVWQGLPREIATALAAQTVKGAAAMVMETGEHPAVLRAHVTSPGGTTMAGIVILQQQAVPAAVMRAVAAAADRTRELSANARSFSREMADVDIRLAGAPEASGVIDSDLEDRS